MYFMSSLRQCTVRSRRIRLMIRIHAWATTGILFVYAFLGFLWGPTFSFADFRATWSAFADDVTVSATVPAPPIVPVVTADTACPLGTLSVSLDWADDSGATSFDVYRDSALLVSGLTDSEYADTNVSAAVDYSYVVVAYGPMGAGVASSDPVVVSTPSDCIASLTPTLTIVTVAGTDVSLRSSVSVSDRTPTLTGTSNMPNASISVSLVGKSSVYATFLTNSNGYWEWTPTSSLPSGSYVLTVTVTHPLYSLQTASDTLTLTITSSSSSDGDDDHDKKKKKKPAVALVSLPTYHAPPMSSSERTLPERLQGAMPGMPVSISLAVANTGGWVFQWRTLETVLTINQLDPSLEGSVGEVSYVVRNALDEGVFESSHSTVVHRGGDYREAIAIPREWMSGDYRVSARLHVGTVDVEAEAPFRVVELPLFDMGGGIVVTWNDAVRFFGWASLWSILLLLLLLLLFVREYWLYAHASRFVSEEALLERGFFGARRGKEVNRL